MTFSDCINKFMLQMLRVSTYHNNIFHGRMVIIFWAASPPPLQLELHVHIVCGCGRGGERAPSVEVKAERKEGKQMGII